MTGWAAAWSAASLRPSAKRAKSAGEWSTPRWAAIAEVLAGERPTTTTVWSAARARAAAAPMPSLAPVITMVAMGASSQVSGERQTRGPAEAGPLDLR